MARISRGCTIKHGVMCPLPFLYAVLWFCIFGAAGISMNRRAIWLENIGTTGYDNADCYLHTGMCFDVAVSISGEAC